MTSRNAAAMPTMPKCSGSRSLARMSWTRSAVPRAVSSWNVFQIAPSTILRPNEDCADDIRRWEYRGTSGSGRLADMGERLALLVRLEAPRRSARTTRRVGQPDRADELYKLAKILADSSLADSVLCLLFLTDISSWRAATMPALPLFRR